MKITPADRTEVGRHFGAGGEECRLKGWVLMVKCKLQINDGVKDKQSTSGTNSVKDASGR